MQSWTISEPTTLILDDAAVRRVRLRVIGGGINVVGSDQRPRLEISDISGQDLDVRLEDGVLDIGYDRRRWSDLGPISFLLGKGFRTTVQLALGVPRHCLVDAEIANGTAMISGINGHVELRGVSGEATLARLTGEVSVETVSGAIEAEQVDGEVSATTISGDVTLVHVSGERTRVETVSGGVAIDIVEPVPAMRIDTVSGDATIRVPAHCSLDARLTTTSGQVASSFPQIKHDGWPVTKAAEGRIGAGGPLLRAHTVSGHVTLLARADEPSEPPVSAGDGGSAA